MYVSHSRKVLLSIILIYFSFLNPPSKNYPFKDDYDGIDEKVYGIPQISYPSADLISKEVYSQPLVK